MKDCTSHVQRNRWSVTWRYLPVTIVLLSCRHVNSPRPCPGRQLADLCSLACDLGTPRSNSRRSRQAARRRTPVPPRTLADTPGYTSCSHCRSRRVDVEGRTKWHEWKYKPKNAEAETWAPTSGIRGRLAGETFFSGGGARMDHRIPLWLARLPGARASSPARQCYSMPSVLSQHNPMQLNSLLQ